MIKSKLKKVIDIFSQNQTITRLFEEFEVDFDTTINSLIEDVLFEYDEVLQENTVLNLAENPDQKGQAEQTQIRIEADTSGSLDGTYFWLYTPSTTYYIWYDATGSTTDPSPGNQTDNPMVGVKVDINIGDDAPLIANKTKGALDSIGDFDTVVSNSYQNVAAAPEVTAIDFTDDSSNSNSNYSGGYFTIFDGSEQYSIWFDVENTSPIPGAGGTLVEVDLTPSDDEEDVAAKVAIAVDNLPEFNANSVGSTVTVETTSPGESTDASEGTVSTVIDVTIVAQGNNAFTQVTSRMTVTNLEEGDVLAARNSMDAPPNFLFTILRQGVSDPLAALNLEVSTVLGLFPQRIASPHETNYRTFKSRGGTLYTYFLKWIYYLYKYFNEEQFFFQNLLEHFVPEYDTKVISSTTNLKIYFDGLGILLDTLDQKIEDLYSLGDIDEIDERFLQHIAQLLGYQKEDFSIKNISFRELIKNLTEIYQRKGTVYSFELFFKLLGFEADLREYYWDRDARNPEGFASITPFDYLYYLTIQDPRTRTQAQVEDMGDTYPIQPISAGEMVEPKDLRVFTELQSDYSLDEILGFKDSTIAPENRFTYFKSNFINFQLTQFYTKQDLTAKDTDTILKYVRFLTPIYVSAFVEVVTTPWEDTFEQSNPLADDIIIEGNPGDPNWVDILLPFLFVTLKEYIPLNLEPAPETAVVVVQNGTTDEDDDGFSDNALPLVFGSPDHGITVQGSVSLSSTTADLSTEKYINLKIDQGRGTRVQIQGNTIQTYQQLINRMNERFTTLGIDATTVAFGLSPNIDIRVASNSEGTSSKIYMANGLTNDLFMSLDTTVENPIDGETGLSGYQEFGLSISDLDASTGLSASRTYNFYINVDDDDFTEIDVSGVTPSETELKEVISAINNHYTTDVSLDFITSTTAEYLDSELLNSGKIAIAFRDVGTNNGKLIITNSDGTPYRSGINFSRFDCRSVTVAASNDIGLKRFFLAYYDLSSDQLKWTVFNNEGDKEINDRVLEGPGAQVQEIKAITLSGNDVALIYTTGSPARAWVRIFDLSAPQETTVSPKEWYGAAITNIDVTTNGTGMVVAGKVGDGGGIIVYLDNAGDFAINDDVNDSTKTFTNTGQVIADIRLEETTDNKIFIVYRSDKSSDPVDYSGYLTIWDDGSSGLPITELSPMNIIDDQLNLLEVEVTDNENILVSYTKRSNDHAYFRVYNSDGDLQKKEYLYYDGDSISELRNNILANGDLVATMVLPNRGHFLNMSYLGNVANSTFDNRLELVSIAAGDTWDDSVENYAQASDQGHRFVMNDSEYVYDNYSSYLRSLGVDFTDERNRYNTFYQTSPNDDLVPLVEDTLVFLFTLLIGADIFPADNVDRVGFYPSRNGYISRSVNPEVEGQDHKGYYLRHQDISEDIRTDDFRIRQELNWPQWKKDKSDKTQEITRITFADDTADGNSNYDGAYFIIYNGLSKFAVWYRLNNATSAPEVENALLLRVNITTSDSPDSIAQKTRQVLVKHPSNSFTEINNQNPLEIKANYEGQSSDAISAAPGYITVNTTTQGEKTLSYNNWSSWAMAIDYFRPSISFPAIRGSGGATFGGTASPAGPFREFVYGVPRGVAAGAWLIEGDPTGKAIIEFTITDPNPAIVWPINAQISYVEETTGTWRSVPVTERTPDGKTVRAEVDHFSVWGVIDASTGELVSDDYVIDVDISDAKVVRVQEITAGPSGLGVFGGTGFPYGPVRDYAAPMPTGSAVVSGEAIALIGADHTAPRPTGSITFAGEAETETERVFTYVPSGRITAPSIIVEPEVNVIYTTIVAAIISSGEAIARFADYVAEAEGGMIIVGDADTEHFRKFVAPAIYGFIELIGVARTTADRDFEWDPTGGAVFTPIVNELSSFFEYEAISTAITITPVAADTTYERLFSYEGIPEILEVTGSAEIEASTTAAYIPSGGLIASEEDIVADELVYDYVAVDPTGGIVINEVDDITIYEADVTQFYTASGGIIVVSSVTDVNPTSVQYFGGIAVHDYQSDTSIQDARALSADDAIHRIAGTLPVTETAPHLFTIIGGTNNNKASSFENLDNHAWSYDDGTGRGGTFYNAPINQILGSGETVLDFQIIKNDIFVFAGTNGKVANYRLSTDEWTYPDGSGAGNRPYHDGTKFNNEDIIAVKIANSSRAILVTTGGKVGNFDTEIGTSGQWTYPDGTTDPSNPPANPWDDGTNAPGIITFAEYTFGSNLYIADDDRLILGGNGFVYNHNFTDNTWTYEDGSGGGEHPYHNSIAETARGVQLSILNQNNQAALVYTFHSDQGVFNYSLSYGWTKPDGLDLSSSPGYQPYNSFGSYNITDISEFLGDIVFSNDNGEVFNYNRYEGWTYGDGSGAGVGIYSNDILGAGVAINDMLRWQKEYVGISQEFFEQDYYLLIGGNLGRIGYFFYNETIPYNSPAFGIGEFSGTAGFQIEILYEANTTESEMAVTGTSNGTIEILRDGQGDLTTALTTTVLVDEVELIFETSGGATIFGSAELSINRILDTSGVAVALNGASWTIEFAREGDGAAVTNGEADYYPEITREGSGSITMLGASSYQEVGL